MLVDYQILVDSLVRDDASAINVTERDIAIGLAVSRYSKDRPQTKVEDLTAPGGQTLALPAAWESGFSGLQSLEYPVGNVPPSMISPGAWGIYNAPGTQQIMVQASLPASATVRASFTVQHVLDDVTDTIDIVDREPVASYAAAILCDQLASLYSGDSDSTIQADSVDHQSKAREFSSRAKTLRKRYYDELGIDPKRNVAAGVVVDLDLSNSLGNDRLLHPGRRR
ncbi:MAG TPA: hypothetical protein ENJ65_04820 [Candidatus Tenderia electrophaga]|uniref:Uncharacterized protein n=1 Tax=Candidatus Tenderia electrophaga TaxID=1748243 RepID=A0A832J5G8_9GAMM|nr:hypothetical protein [Candidatus Tenderia electrophaga]